MAGYEARIDLIVSNLDKIKQLQDKLNAVQNTLESIQSLQAKGALGRFTSVDTYAKATQAIQKNISGIAAESLAIAKGNDQIKRRIVLESLLRREQSRTERLSRAFIAETKGLDQTSGALKRIKEQFDEVSKGLKAAFKSQDIGLISTLRSELSALIEDQREYNRALAGTKNTGVNTDLLKEQARGYKQQIDQLRRRASALAENEEILRKLNAAEQNLVKQRTKLGTFTNLADPRLGREILANVKSQIVAEEDLARVRARTAAEYTQQQRSNQREILNTVKIITGTAAKAASATIDAVTFGRGAQTIRGARNAAIRGGLGLGALGVGKIGVGIGAAGAATAEFMSKGPQSFIGGPAIAAIEKFNQVLNSALGGVPEIVSQAVQALGQIPDSLGLAAVAALAFAPAVSTATKSVFNLGRAVGNTSFGKPVAQFLRDVNPLAKAAYGSVEALQQGLDRLRGDSLDIKNIFEETDRQRQVVEQSLRLPIALPAAGQTSFRGEVRRGIGGSFIGGGARELRNPEFLVNQVGDIEDGVRTLAARSQEAADATLMFAEKLGAADVAAESFGDSIAGLSPEIRAMVFALNGISPALAEAAAEFNRFKLDTLAENANSYTRALLNQKRTLDEYTDSANKASRAVSGLGYSGELPALRPAGFTNQDVRIKNLVDDQAKAIRINSELEIELDKIATFAAIDNIQREYDYEIDKIEDTLRARIKADEEFWAASKRNLNEADARAKAERDNAAKPFLEQRFGKRGGAAISEGLVGGAFPLLFGQGLGASVFGGLGGAAGGFAGGGLGFGLSLVGTALGTAFDTTVAAASELGGALNDLTTTFEVVKNRALFSSRETEKLASKFEEAGFVATASILAQEEVIRKIGTSGVRDLKNLETASDRLSRAWAEFTLQLQVALAGPMAGLLDWVTQIVLTLGTFKNQDEFAREVGAGLSGKDKEEFDRRYAEIERLSRESILKGGLTPGQASDQKLLLARQFFGRSRVSGAVKTDADLLLQEQVAGAETFVNALNARLSALDLGKSLIDQVKSAAQEQEDLDRQRAKAVEDYERAIGDIRLGVERTIQSKRLDNLSRENEIYAKQGDIRLQQLKNENAIARESLRGNDLGQQLFDIVAQYSEEQLATENEIANRRRSLEAELQSVAIETEQYKADVAKQVADLNRSTAEQVQQIQLSAARKQDQSAKYRFDLEKKIAIAQIQVQRFTAQQEIRKLQTLADAEPDQGNKAVLEKSINEYRSVIEGAGPGSLKDIEKSLSSLQPPAPLSYAGFNTGQGVSLAGYDAVIAKGNELRLRLEELAKAFDGLVAAGKFIEVNSLLKDFADQGATEAANQSKDLKYQFDLLAGAAGAVDPRLEQLAKGQAKLLETTAGSKEEFKKLVPLYVQLAEQNIKAADTYQFFNSAIDDNLGQIESLKEEINGLLAGTTEYEKALLSLTQRGLSPASEEAQRLLASAQELDRLKDKIEVINNIRDAATGFTESLRGLVEQFIELRDAGKAVKAFSEDLGKKSLSFVLDLAFKPIEETMQKQFIAFADKLGIDVRPEALKQLTELQQINNNVDSINKKIEPIVSSLAAQQKKAEAEALAKAQQQQALAAQAGAGAVYGQTSGPVSTQFGGLRKELADWLQTYDIAINAQLREIYSAQQVTSASNTTRAQTLERIRGGSNFNSQEKLILERGVNDIINKAIQERIKQLSAMTGQGGPDMSDSALIAQAIRGSGVAFPMDSASPPAAPVAGAGPQPIQVIPYGSTGQTANDAVGQVFEGAAGSLGEFDAAVWQTAAGTQKAADNLNQASGQWLKNLGTAVTGLAGAATGVLAIAGGVSQIKEGGVYGTLTGLAGIFGGIASITSMFGTGGALSGVFGGGGSTPSLASLSQQAAGPTVFQMANGGRVGGNNPYLVGEQGPELFVPDSSGMIISNNDLFSATRDAIASGSIDGDMEDDASDEPGLSSYRSTFSGGQGDQKALQEARDAIQAVNGMPGAAGANGLNGTAGADGQQMLYDANGNPIGMFASTRSAVASASLAAKARANESSLFGANKDALAVAAGGGVAGPLAATRMQVMQQQAAAERNSEMTRIESIVSKPAKMDISYKSQVINNVEYVTAEQAERMSRESAKKGRDLAIGALQASVKARRTAGLI